MKRHPQLQPLSREHHNGLLMALLLNKGIKKAAATDVMAAFILHYWQTNLQQHFEEEETVLIPLLQTTAFDPALIRQLLNEHAALRAYIHSIEDGFGDLYLLEDFAALLEDHIRFEERTLFPEAEKLLSVQQFSALEGRLTDLAATSCINYPVKFWE